MAKWQKLAAAAFVVWVDMLADKAGDQLRFRLKDPHGQVMFERKQQIKQSQARRFVYMGMWCTSNAWAAGTYTGEVTHTCVVEGPPIEKKIVTAVDIQ